MVGPGERVRLRVGAAFRRDDVVTLDAAALPSVADAEATGMPGLFDALAADGVDAVHVALHARYRNVVGEPTTRTVAAGRLAVESALTVGEIAGAIAPDAAGSGDG